MGNVIVFDLENKCCLLKLKLKCFCNTYMYVHVLVHIPVGTGNQNSKYHTIQVCQNHVGMSRKSLLKVRI